MSWQVGLPPSFLFLHILGTCSCRKDITYKDGWSPHLLIQETKINIKISNGALRQSFLEILSCENVT